MALPTRADLTAYCRIETTAEDALLDQLLVRATAMVESVIGRPITARAGTFTDPAETGRAYGRITTLQVPRWPFDAASVTVTDVDGVVVDPTTYRLVPACGQIVAVAGVDFPNGPYTIAATVGLSTDPEYAARLEPLLSAAILDLAADLYQNRSPASERESAGGGVSIAYGREAIPPRTMAMLALAGLVGVSA